MSFRICPECLIRSAGILWFTEFFWSSILISEIWMLVPQASHMSVEEYLGGRWGNFTWTSKGRHTSVQILCHSSKKNSPSSSRKQRTIFLRAKRPKSSRMIYDKALSSLSCLESIAIIGFHVQERGQPGGLADDSGSDPLVIFCGILLEDVSWAQNRPPGNCAVATSPLILVVADSIQRARKFPGLSLCCQSTWSW